MTEWIAFQKVSPQKEKTEDDIQNNFLKRHKKTCIPYPFCIAAVGS